MTHFSANEALAPHSSPQSVLQLLSLWRLLGDVPVDESGDHLDQAFLHFPQGTHRYEIWHWLESLNPCFCIGLASSVRNLFHIVAFSGGDVTLTAFDCHDHAFSAFREKAKRLGDTESVRLFSVLARDSPEAIESAKIHYISLAVAPDRCAYGLGDM
ncbi:hypothetical protein [Halioglobus sp. HI00S01]|uniref:hypothetical protein n=1 Tax=Halioglobus sp. HI00S01 TaxID=1822214 RepID=UPI0012E9013F|nr:hypothetical protein [Halioglobus sp. HI00S01]